MRFLGLQNESGQLPKRCWGPGCEVRCRADLHLEQGSTPPGPRSRKPRRGSLFLCVIPFLFKVARKRKQAARRRFLYQFSAGRLYFEQQPSPSCDPAIPCSILSPVYLFSNQIIRVFCTATKKDSIGKSNHFLESACSCLPSLFFSAPGP